MKVAIGENGFEMNYEVIPDLLPMDTLFIHGNLASNAWWRPSLEIWKSRAQSHYRGRAILAEWRGCGDSGHPQSEEELALELMADDYNALLSKLQVRRVCVVGHSTGGLIALLAIAKRPDLYAHGFLLDSVSAGGREFTPALLDAYQKMKEDRAVCGTLLGAAIYGQDLKSPLFQSLLDDACRISQHNWLGVPRALANVDVRSKLKEIRTPLTIAHGEFDKVLPIEKSKQMAEALPYGTFLELKNQGHCMNIENPNGFVELVNRTLFGTEG